MSRLLQTARIGQALPRMWLPEVVRPDDRGMNAIDSFSEWGLGPSMAGSTGASVAWPSTNAAIFTPFRVPVPVVVTHLAVGTGTGTTGNFDLGIYDPAGNLIVSTGSTAKTTASSERIVDITDTLLRPGFYYFGMSADGTAPYINHSYVSVLSPGYWAGREMASAFPLPSTATFATQALVYWPKIAAYVKLERIKPWYGPVRWPPMNVISTLHPESLGPALGTIGIHGNSAASGAMGDDIAYYYPFRLHECATAVKMSVVIGGTSSGDHEVGIYSADGARIVTSGTTAQAALNTRQEFDITDTRLGPGLYYMAYQCHNGTGTILRMAPADELVLPAAPVYQESVGAPGLPATMTPAVSTSATPLIALMGVHFNTLV